MRKTKTEAQLTRRQLLDAALNVFYRQGVAHASLQEIAAEAGLTRGALYWHFRNKEDLFAALFQDWFQDIGEDLNRAAEHTDPWQHLAACLNNTFGRIENDRRHYQFFSILYLKCEHTERNAAFIALAERYRNLCREHLAAALAACFRQPENMETALLYLESLLAGLIRVWIVEPQRFSLGGQGGQIVAALMAQWQNQQAKK